MLMSLLPALAVSSSSRIGCVGIVEFRPDGVKQTVSYYPNGNWNKAFTSKSDTHFSDGALIGPEQERAAIFELASRIYDSSTIKESAALTSEEVLADKRKNVVIVFIQTDDHTKHFERAYDKEFDSPDLKKLDAFLKSLLEK